MHDEAKIQFDEKVQIDLEAKKQELIDNPPEPLEEGVEPPPEDEPFVPEFEAS